MFFVEVSREEVFLFIVRDSLSEPQEEQKIDIPFRFSSALKTQRATTFETLASHLTLTRCKTLRVE